MAVPCIDLDFSFGGGSGGAAPVSGSGMTLVMGLPRGAVEPVFARMVWWVSRPGWAQAGWWDADLRYEVRQLMLLPVGPVLHHRLVALAAADRGSGFRRGECPLPHATASVEERLGVPGRPCACQS